MPLRLFTIESQDEGVFAIRTQDDQDVCSLVFEDNMGGALEHKAQKILVQKLSEAMQKVCYAYWNNQE